MKKIFLIALLAAQTTLAVEFEIGQKQDPLVVKITECSDYACYDGTLKGDALKNYLAIRSHVNSRDSDLEIRYVKNHWRSDYVNYGHPYKNQIALKIQAALVSASERCPVSVTVERNTFKIIKVNTTCDIF